MDRRIALSAIVACALMIVAGETSAPARESGKPSAGHILPDPHHHSVSVSRMKPDSEVVASFRYQAVTAPAGPPANQRRSPGGRFRAFTISDTSGSRIFVEEIATHATHEIAGLPLPWRPFDKLVWIGPTTLIFDRWSQPHFGIHYAIDVAKGKLLLASQFPG